MLSLASDTVNFSSRIIKSRNKLETISNCVFTRNNKTKLFNYELKFINRFIKSHEKVIILIYLYKISSK